MMLIFLKVFDDMPKSKWIQDDLLNTLAQEAETMRDRAYVPYSHYRVGVALHSTDGRIFGGCNIENAAYPACICGERTALVKAVSEGATEFDALVLITDNGGTPCGLCRQMLYEFAPQLPIICLNGDGEIVLEARLSEFLPHGFGPKDLTK